MNSPSQVQVVVGEVHRIGDDTWAVAVPFAGSPLRYTWCYLLAGRDGRVVVVDPGLPSPDGIPTIQAALRSTGRELADVAGIVATHSHIDHDGLAAELVGATGAWVAGGSGRRDHGVPDLAADSAWLRRCGLSAGDIDSVSIAGFDLSMFTTAPTDVVRLDDGAVLPIPGRSVRVVATPGHTEDHICLHDPGLDLFFSGDHVLPRVTPHIGIHGLDARPALADYLRSLHAVVRFDGALVLPGHEWSFSGLGARVAELERHHARRCTEILEALAPPRTRTAWQVASDLSWSRGWSGIVGPMRRLAVAETVAHLQYLVDLGQVSADGSPDPDVVVGYRRS